MENNVEKIFVDIRAVLICICITSLILAIMQIIELMRFHNYGKVSIDKKVDCMECLWWRKTNSGNNVDIPYCIRPRAFKRPDICEGQCRYMKYSNLPEYPKSLAYLVMEAMLVIVNFIIVTFSFISEIL